MPFLADPSGDPESACISKNMAKNKNCMPMMKIKRDKTPLTNKDSPNINLWYSENNPPKMPIGVNTIPKK